MKRQEEIFNLASGYPRPQDQLLVDELAIAARTLTAGDLANSLPLFHQFANNYFSYAGQSFVAQQELSVHPALSASQGIGFAANILHKNNIRAIGVINPAPSFIHSLLRSEGLKTSRISEGDIYSANKSFKDIDALYLILPNNPTGRFVDEESFRCLMCNVKAAGIPVVVDFCFRLHASLHQWDQYRIMNEEGVRFICIEDTGKSLPAGGLKAAMVVAHDNFKQDLRVLSEAHGAPSALTMRVLGQKLGKAGATPEDLPLRAVFAENLDILKSSGLFEIKRTEGLSCVGGFAEILTHCPGTWMQDAFNAQGISVHGLSGYYDNGTQGLRISLGVDPALMRTALSRLSQKQYEINRHVAGIAEKFALRWAA